MDEPMIGMEPAAPAAPVAAPAPVVQRERPEPDKARQELVTQWSDRLERAEKHWEGRFKKMRWSQQFVRGKQWDGMVENDDRYTVNITHRHIKQRTDAIYAKNPRFVAKRRPRMLFTVWDEAPETLQMAQQQMAIATQPQVDPMTGAVMPPPMVDPAAAMMAQAVIQDFQQGKAEMERWRRIARTLEILLEYCLKEPRPRLKRQLKQAVRRSKTNGVAYVQLGYQRVMTRDPAIESELRDVMGQLEAIEVRLADLADAELEQETARAEELRLAMADLQSQVEKIAREGLVFDFPASTDLIIDPACKQLSGFVGARWVARRFDWEPDEIKKRYGVDVGANYTKHDAKGKRTGDKDCSLARVYVVYDLELQIVYHVCVGYPDFLKEPGAPDVVLEQFHPFFTLAFNDLEDEEDPYPLADPELLRHQQMEYNRAREGLRKHRIGQRPAWVGAKGALSAEDKSRLMNHDDGEYIEMDGLSVGSDQKIGDKLMAKPTQPIDAGVYDTEFVFADIQRQMGEQEANFGGTSKDTTATEATISEHGRVSGLQSDIDELDEFLSDIGQAAAQILLMNMSEETVKRIVGPGAVWPGMTRQQVYEEIEVEVLAGSSGRPNKALKLANLERVGPVLVQVPGIAPSWLGREIVTAIDDGTDLTEAIQPGLPSITAMNGMMQPSTGNPGTDPNAQGPQGGDNAPAPAQTEGGPKPPPAPHPSNVPTVTA